MTQNKGELIAVTYHSFVNLLSNKPWVLWKSKWVDYNKPKRTISTQQWK